MTGADRDGRLDNRNPDETHAADPGRAVGRLSLAFLVDMVTHGVAGLSSREALLVLAINQANIAPLTRDPAARRRHGTLRSPAPDAQRRPVSINAVAASLRLPFETVRRHVRKLEAQDVCRTSGGGVIVPETFLASPAYLASVGQAHERLWAFYRDLSAAGLLGPLPPSSFPPGEPLPVRSAARLLADYILRAVDSLARETGDLVSTLVLLGLLEASLEDPPRPIQVAALARRLRLPVETVRRHAVELVEKGLCARVAGGLLAPAPEPFLRANAADVQRLFAGLAERGVVRLWDQISALSEARTA